MGGVDSLVLIIEYLVLLEYYMVTRICGL
jgi:hypothetical protein